MLIDGVRKLSMQLRLRLLLCLTRKPVKERMTTSSTDSTDTPILESGVSSATCMREQQARAARWGCCEHVRRSLAGRVWFVLAPCKAAAHAPHQVSERL